MLIANFLTPCSVFFETLSYRRALIIYCAFFTLVFLPFFTGKVVLPYAQLTELGVTPDGTPLENYADIKTGNLNDIPLAFIPNIHQILGTEQVGVFNSWTNAAELGRPLPQRSYSTTWLPNWLLAQLIDDPFLYYTVHCLLMTMLSGLFLFGLLKAWQLHPFACLCGAIFLATWPHNVYRFGFSMHVATFCWTIALMYGSYLFYRQPRGWQLLFIAFSAYSLLLTGYLQEVIFLAYFIVGYGILLVSQKYHRDGFALAARYLFFCCLAAISGLILSLPVYLDLIYDSFNSTRVGANTDFFLSDLPSLSSGTRIFKFLGTTFHPDMFGNPLSDTYPYNSQGRSFNMILLLLLPLSFAGLWRKTRGWWWSIAILSALVLVAPLYKLGVLFLGFNISPMSPLTFLILPMSIIAAFTVDMLLKDEYLRDDLNRWTKRSIKFTAFILSLIFLFPIIKMKLFYPAYFVGAAALIYLFWVSISKPYFHTILFVLICTTTLFSSWPMVDRQAQSLDQLALNSPLSQSIAAVTNSDKNTTTNFAIVSQNPEKFPPTQQIMSPNIHILAGLSSIHSFNSVSSHHYKKLIESLNGVVHVNGRYNFNINPDFDSPAFYLSNINLVLSDKALSHPNIEFYKHEGSMFLYKVNKTIDCCIRYPADNNEDIAALSLSDILAREQLPVTKSEDNINQLIFDIDTRGTKSSALTLSQKFHGKWKAWANINDEWIAVPTFAAGDIFQSAHIPANAKQLKLEFKPFISYAWISFVVFAIWSLATLILGQSRN